MQLTKGSRLGPYEILAHAGAGGMGDVYTARDTRLPRTVAIKVLPPRFAGSDEFARRFEREARAIAALNHPHICTLYDIGRENERAFLVMEYLEGETLARRLRKGRLPLDQVLRYGIEIADALEAAHRHGVVHRDLKPANIMITRSGAKLLDFGLAKKLPAPSPRAETTDAREASTAEERLTPRGMVLGTLEFMAPEQLENKEADARTDIFAFGNVLYRMATGHPPFEGTRTENLVHAILEADPRPMTTYMRDCPPALERLVRACLAKNPDDRIQTAHDVLLQLKWIADENAEALQQADNPRAWKPYVAGVIVATVLAGAAYLVVAERSQRREPLTFSIPLPAPIDLSPDRPDDDLAIAPDGKLIAVSLFYESERRLYLRRFTKPELVPLAGTEDAYDPFFSPDGKWIGFAAAGRLYKMPVGGGPPVQLCAAESVRGAVWLPDDSIVFATRETGLLVVPAAGGKPIALTRLDKSRKEATHRWPHLLPDGKTILYTINDARGDYSQARIGIVDTRTRATATVYDGGTDARYVSTGHLVFERDRKLFAVPFDAKSHRVTGEAHPIVENVGTASGSGLAMVDVSANGTLVYVPYDAVREQRQLVWVDRRGLAAAASAQHRNFSQPAIAPDGQSVLVTVGEGHCALWLMDVRTDSWVRLTQDVGCSDFGVWSHDGRNIYYTWKTDRTPYNIYVLPADASAPPKQLTNRDDWPFPLAITPDSRLIVFNARNAQSDDDLWTLDTNNSIAKPLLNTGGEGAADLSPDGKWIAYASDESGATQVYVQQFPLTGRRWLVAGGVAPKWSRDGAEIFFWENEDLMAAKVMTKPAFSVAQTTRLFSGTYAPAFDVSTDGRFLMVKNSDKRAAPELRVVLNWFDDVRVRMGNAQTTTASVLRAITSVRNR